MDPEWMQWIPCSVIECSGFHAAWLNAVDSIQPGKMHAIWMQWIPCSVIECRVFHAAWRNGTLLNAGDFMQHDWRQWIPAEYLNAVDFMQHGLKYPYLMQWIPCSVIECSGFHAAWRNGTLFNAGNFMQHDWMQWIPAAWLNAVDFLQHGQKHPDCMQWSPCSEAQCILIERSAYHAVWLNGSRLNAVDSMQCGVVDSDWMHRGAVYHNWMQWIR